MQNVEEILHKKMFVVAHLMFHIWHFVENVKKIIQRLKLNIFILWTIVY